MTRLMLLICRRIARFIMWLYNAIFHYLNQVTSSLPVSAHVQCVDAICSLKTILSATLSCTPRLLPALSVVMNTVMVLLAIKTGNLQVQRTEQKGAGEGEDMGKDKT
jgi:hypothetical protein